ncbi:diphosphomevalonate decarboxylase [Ditylenchus destructor]|nr:diphosphomevalonate decarboxylase [Ditylenchus destructor]
MGRRKCNWTIHFHENGFFYFYNSVSQTSRWYWPDKKKRENKAILEKKWHEKRAILTAFESFVRKWFSPHYLLSVVSFEQAMRDVGFKGIRPNSELKSLFEVVRRKLLWPQLLPPQLPLGPWPGSPNQCCCLFPKIPKEKLVLIMKLGLLCCKFNPQSYSTEPNNENMIEELHEPCEDNVLECTLSPSAKRSRPNEDHCSEEGLHPEISHDESEVSRELNSIENLSNEEHDESSEIDVINLSEHDCEDVLNLESRVKPNIEYVELPSDSASADTDNESAYELDVNRQNTIANDSQAVGLNTTPNCDGSVLITLEDDEVESTPEDIDVICDGVISQNHSQNSQRAANTRDNQPGERRMFLKSVKRYSFQDLDEHVDNPEHKRARGRYLYVIPSLAQVKEALSNTSKEGHTDPNLPSSSKSNLRFKDNGFVAQCYRFHEELADAFQCSVTAVSKALAKCVQSCLGLHLKPLGISKTLISNIRDMIHNNGYGEDTKSQCNVIFGKDRVRIILAILDIEYGFEDSSPLNESDSELEHINFVPLPKDLRGACRRLNRIEWHGSPEEFYKEFHLRIDQANDLLGVLVDAGLTSRSAVSTYWIKPHIKLLVTLQHYATTDTTLVDLEILRGISQSAAYSSIKTVSTLILESLDTDKSLDRIAEYIQENDWKAVSDRFPRVTIPRPHMWDADSLWKLIVKACFLIHHYLPTMTEVMQEPTEIAEAVQSPGGFEELILPLNDSVSININALAATTTITVGPHIENDSVMLNGKEVRPQGFARFCRVFEEIRRLTEKKERKRTHSGQPKTEISKEPWHIRVISETNFPIAAGLASSAAGFAAIAYGLGQLFQLEENEIVRLARIGSGSACRSVKSGFVHWKAYEKEGDDSDSSCETIAPASHWPNLRAVIIVLNELEKQTGSSVGMRNTANTSLLMPSRIKDVVPKRVKELIGAIKSKNFETLAQITMAESNQLHAVCLDTTPPLIYMNADSHLLIAFVNSFNEAFGVKVAYTFDAGPNCCLILEEETLPILFFCLKKCFKFDYALIPKDAPTDLDSNDVPASSNFPWSVSRDLQVKNIICSEVGIGPRVLSNTANGKFPESCACTSQVSAVCKML